MLQLPSPGRATTIARLNSRKLVIAAGVLVLTVVVAAAAITFLTARDEATVDRVAGPGTERAGGAAPRVEPGNVVILHRAASAPAPLRALAEELAGPATPALEAAGQAVIVRRDSGQRVALRAVSATHGVEADDAGDPRLREFVEFWLGRDAR